MEEYQAELVSIHNDLESDFVLSFYSGTKFWTGGRRECDWCEGWVWDHYIIDWVGEPLCDPCFDRHYDGVDDGEPPRPNAVDHRANTLLVLLPPLHACGFEVTRHVASFLEDRYRPGAGSRWTPVSGADQPRDDRLLHGGHQ